MSSTTASRWGYRCLNNTPNWYQDEGTQYWLILVIVLIIYFMCSILFESFRLPFVIITLIPVSFIGTFPDVLLFRSEVRDGRFRLVGPAERTGGECRYLHHQRVQQPNGGLQGAGVASCEFVRQGLQPQDYSGVPDHAFHRFWAWCRSS